MAAIVLALVGIIFILGGVQMGIWLSPRSHLRSSIPVLPTYTVPNATKIQPNPKLWDLIGSEAYWKTPQGRTRIMADVAESARLVDDTMAKISNDTNEPDLITRGVFVTLPSSPNDAFLKQLRTMLLSWLLIRDRQPENFRTDLVVATSGQGAEYARELGCTDIPRSNAGSNSSCVIVNYVMLEDRAHPEGDANDPLLSYGLYLNSIVPMAEYSGYMYHFAIRTDLDCFIMPGFADWMLPKGTNVIVGQGGYIVDNSKAHLAFVSKELNLRNEYNHDNVGSTWYGRLDLMRSLAKLSLSASRWLLTQEFSKFEACCSGVLSWPHWHYHVTSMYSGHLALNHVGHFSRSSQETGYLDFGAASTESALDTAVKHVHCWHSNDDFSKFKHQLGKYDNLDLSPHIDMNKVNDYAMVVAISSDRLNSDEFKLLVSGALDVKKNYTWQRPHRVASQ